jgi:hypothetical protein
MIGSIYQLEDRLGESVRLFCPCEVEVTPAAYAALLCPLPRDSDHAPARSPSNPSPTPSARRSSVDAGTPHAHCGPPEEIVIGIAVTAAA